MTQLPDAAWIRRLRKKLLQWYASHARDLPWRQQVSPYRIWVSEIMLQQTQVAKVRDYFLRFISQYPTVRHLAEADEQQVLRSWEGLGYYRRARQLHAAARIVVQQHDGVVPDDFERLRQLPGIGRYSAGAILSIGSGKKYPILEANTQRLYCRLLACDDDPRQSATQKTLWSFAEKLLPAVDCGDFNQALMDLGSSVCSPRTPDCLNCPLRQLCRGRADGQPERFPVGTAKVQYEQLWEAAVAVQRRSQFLLRRCQVDERWAGLWDFPRYPHAQPSNLAAPNQSGPNLLRPNQSNLWHELAEQVESATGLTVRIDRQLTTIKHGVTRYRITLSCFHATVVQGRLKPSSDFRWVSQRELLDLPLSTTGRKLAGMVVPP